MSGIVDEMEIVLGEHSSTKEALTVSNLKYDIGELESLLRKTGDPIIKKHIIKRLETKRRSLKTAEEKEDQKLRQSVENWLSDVFKRIVEEVSPELPLDLDEFHDQNAEHA